MLTDNGRTALILAVKNGHDAVVHLLLDAGADVNYADFSGETALTTAAARDHVTVVQHLVDAGANVNHGDNGRTALIIAARNGHEGVVQLLLDAGFDINHVDNNGRTALLTAARHGHDGVVQLLLDAGADPEQIRITGQSGNSSNSMWYHHRQRAATVVENRYRRNISMPLSQEAKFLDFLETKIALITLAIQDTAQCNTFIMLLKKLPDTADFRSSPSGIQTRVESLMEALREDVVKDHIIPYIETEQRCGDRSIAQLQQLEIAADIGRWESSNAIKGVPKARQVEFFSFLKGLLYRAALEQYITEHDGKESVETMLAAELQLGETYHFPHRAMAMRYPNCANQTVVGEAASYLAGLSTGDLLTLFEERFDVRTVLENLLTEKMFPEAFEAKEAAARAEFSTLSEAPEESRNAPGFEERYRLAGEKCKKATPKKLFVREKLTEAFQALAPS